MNQIEYNVDKAAVFVEKAKDNVRIAKDYQKGNRKVWSMELWLNVWLSLSLSLSLPLLNS